MQLSTSGIKIPFSWVPIGLCIPSLLHCPTTRYQDLSRGLKAKHMLKTIKKPCQITHYKFWNWCKKIWADIIAYFEIEMHSFSSQLYKMVTFKNLELSANFIHQIKTFRFLGPWIFFFLLYHSVSLEINSSHLC